MNTNLFFILGQIGLFMAAICGVGIIHIVGQSPTRPRWYYFVVVWLVSVACAFLFSQPYVTPGLDPLPDIPYLFRFVVGLEHTAVFINYYFQRGGRMPVGVILGVNRYVGWVTALVMVAFLVYGQYSRLSDSDIETTELKQEIREIKADTLRETALKESVDSLNDQAGIRTYQLGMLTRELLLVRKQNKQIIENQFLILSNQKRLLEQAKVQAVPQPTPPPPTRRQRRKMASHAGFSDSLYYSRSQTNQNDETTNH